jgi:hypothetical protein
MQLVDLERIGVPRAQVMARLPSASITAMVGSQYYLIDFVHPAAFLGYLALLEGYPHKPDKLERLMARTDLPAAAWSTYKLHADVDPWHREEIVEILDQVPADAALRRAIIANGLRTADWHCQALEQLAATAAAERAA